MVNVAKLLEIDAQKVTGLTFGQYKAEKNFSDPKFFLRFYISDEDDYPSQVSLIIDSAMLKNGLLISA